MERHDHVTKILHTGQPEGTFMQVTYTEASLPDRKYILYCSLGK